MALILTSNQSYAGDVSDLPPINAPLPSLASVYADLVRGEFVDTLRGEVQRYNHPNNDVGCFSVRAASGKTFINADGERETTTESFSLRYQHDPRTGETLGVILDEGRMNLFPDTENVAASSWTKVGLQTVTADSDGFANIVANSGSSLHYISEESTVISESVGTISVDVKAVSGSNAYVGLWYSGGAGSEYAVFEAATGKIVRTGMRASYSTSSPGPDGSWRLTMWSPVETDAGWRVALLDSPDRGINENFEADGLTVKLRAPMLQSSLTAQQYQVGSNTYDTLDMRVELYSLGESGNATFFFSGITADAPASCTALHFIGQDTLTAGYDEDRNYRGMFRVGEVEIPSLYWGQNRLIEFMLVIRSGDIFIYTDGEMIDTGVSLPANGVSEGLSPVRVILGRSGSKSGHWKGPIKKFIYYPVALTDAQARREFNAQAMR